jgi:hypothetical protein
MEVISMGESTPLYPLSSRAWDILDHPDQMDSIEDTDPIWHELYRYIVDIWNWEEENITIEEKAKLVRRFRPNPEIDELLSPL